MIISSVFCIRNSELTLQRLCHYCSRNSNITTRNAFDILFQVLTKAPIFRYCLHLHLGCTIRCCHRTICHSIIAKDATQGVVVTYKIRSFPCRGRSCTNLIHTYYIIAIGKNLLWLVLERNSRSRTITDYDRISYTNNCIFSAQHLCATHIPGYSRIDKCNLACIIAIGTYREDGTNLTLCTRNIFCYNRIDNIQLLTMIKKDGTTKRTCLIARNKTTIQGCITLRCTI